MSSIIEEPSSIISENPTVVLNTDDVLNTDKPLKIFTQKEKIKMCSSMTSKQRDMLITFGRVDKYKLPNIKDDKWVTKIIDRVKTQKSAISYMTIVYEKADEACPFPHYHIAIKIDSKNPVRCGSVKKKLYEIFDTYHGNIDISIKNTNCYLDKAKYLICPVKDKIIDPLPKIYGETIDELMKRIENSANGAKRRREIEENWTTELIEAARESEGNYAVFMESEAFKTLGWNKPFQCITAFRELSKTKPIIIEEQTFPIEDYREDVIAKFDEWYNSPKTKGDVLIVQGPPDTGKTRFLFSWAKHRNIEVFKAPASMREWYTYDNQDLIIWDDISEDRKDLGGQRMAQLLDNQIVDLDIKCAQGIKVQCSKIIMTMNEEFIMENAPEKFQARCCLIKVHSHLTKKPIKENKFAWKRMDIYQEDTGIIIQK